MCWTNVIKVSFQNSSPKKCRAYFPARVKVCFKGCQEGNQRLSNAAPIFKEKWRTAKSIDLQVALMSASNETLTWIWCLRFDIPESKQVSFAQKQNNQSLRHHTARSRARAVWLWGHFSKHSKNVLVLSGQVWTEGQGHISKCHLRLFFRICTCHQFKLISLVRGAIKCHETKRATVCLQKESKELQLSDTDRTQAQNYKKTHEVWLLQTQLHYSLHSFEVTTANFLLQFDLH